MQIYAVVYLNRSGLADLLYNNEIIYNKSMFDEFIVGFNQASPLLSIVDVGKGKEAADAKVRGVCYPGRTQSARLNHLYCFGIQRCCDCSHTYPRSSECILAASAIVQ